MPLSATCAERLEFCVRAIIFDIRFRTTRGRETKLAYRLVLLAFLQREFSTVEICFAGLFFSRGLIGIVRRRLVGTVCAAMKDADLSCREQTTGAILLSGFSPLRESLRQQGCDL